MNDKGDGEVERRDRGTERVEERMRKKTEQFDSNWMINGEKGREIMAHRKGEGAERGQREMDRIRGTSYGRKKNQTKKDLKKVITIKC